MGETRICLTGKNDYLFLQVMAYIHVHASNRLLYLFSFCFFAFQFHDTYCKICTRRKVSQLGQEDFLGLCNILETRCLLGIKRAKDSRMMKVCLASNKNVSRQTFTWVFKCTTEARARSKVALIHCGGRGVAAG